ncbi:hypothetical protein IIA94_02995 [Patescibacteria group bacterium]|nr:hypothetical protein [Patescibacteria group bacterium]
MKTTTALTMGVDAFTLLDLFRKVAAGKGLKILQVDSSRAHSEPIRVYTLGGKLLAVLAKQRIKRRARPDCKDRIFTLVDENPQNELPGWKPSNYWNFEQLKGDEHNFNLRVSLSIELGLGIEKRGVVLLPLAHGTLVSAGDQLPNFRMFKALVENDGKAPEVAKELAISNGSIVVTWTDLGLGGIRKLTDLFAEFAGGKKSIVQLNQNQKVFDPVPSPRHQKPCDELFIAEPAQSIVIQTWRSQLHEYCNSLVA